MKSLKEFIAENLENPTVPTVQENTGQTNEDRAEKVMKMIKEISQGKGFIISDFMTEFALELSDEIYLLHDGILKQIKDLTELQQHYYLPKSI